MELNKYVETKETEVFETETHIFKISKEKLDAFQESNSPKSLKKLKTAIQKGLRQRVEECDGKRWEESFEMIFKDITGGQTQL